MLKAGAATFAGYAALQFYPIETDIIDKIDNRTHSLGQPVGRKLLTFTIPVGQTISSQRLDLNGKIEQITLSTGAAGGATTVLTVIDELGATLFTSSAVNQSTKAKLMTADAFAFVTGRQQVTVTISSTHSSVVTIRALVYVR